MNRKTRFKYTLSLLLALALLFQFIPAQAFANGNIDHELTVAVISDLHVMPPSMWSDNPDSAAAVSADRKMFAESAAIFDAAIDGIINEAPDVVLVPGDLTKDGEYDAHVYVAEKLAGLKAALPDTEIYVINGNHDINNPNAYDYSSGAGVPVHSATPEEFREVYSGLGYGDSTSKYFTPTVGQAGSNSYVTRPADGFTVIAIDAAKYSADATRSGLDRQETGGNISAELLAWVLEKVQEAEERGDTVIAFMHHGLVPHFSLESTMLADFLADNYIKAAEALANAGVRYVFTGHMHAQNIASMTSVAGNTLYDIETGSLVTYPSPVRYANFIKGVDSEGNPTEKVGIKSKFVKEIDFIDPTTGEKITNLTRYGYDNSIDKDTVGSLMMGVVSGGFIDISSLLGGLLDAEFTTTGGQLHTGSRALFESLLPAEDAEGNAVSNDFGDFMINMMREMLPATQADGIDVQGLVRIFYEANNSRVRMAALGGIGNLYITDANMRAYVVNTTFTQLDALLSSETYVNALFSRVVASLVDMRLYTDADENEYTFFDLVKYVYLAHLAGDAVSTPWVDAIIAGLFDSSISAKIGDYLSDRLMYELGGVFDDIMINTNSLITNDILGALLKSTFVSAMGGNPAPLGGILDIFGIDFLALVGGDALGDLLPDSMANDLGNTVGGLAISFIEGSGDSIGDNDETLIWVGSNKEPIVTLPDPDVNSNDKQNIDGSTTVSGQIRNIAGDPIIAEVQLHWGKVGNPYQLSVVTTYPTDERGHFTYEIPALEDTDVYEMRIRVSKGSEYEFVEVPFEVKEGWNTTINVNIARIADDLTLRGWYAGDGHQHSTNSDGRDSVAAVARQNIAAGNHWGILTDHNTTTGVDSFANVAKNFPTDFAGSFFPVSGYEWTSRNGHMNVFTPQANLDNIPMGTWNFPAELNGEALNAENLKRILDIQAAGGFVQANHPTTIPFLNNVGIDNFIKYWFVDAIEVWNAGMPVVFEGKPYDKPAVLGYEPIQGWFNLLNGGARTAATATTDSHTLDVLKNSADTLDVGMIGGMLSLLVDDKGNLNEETFDSLLPMIGDLFGGFGSLPSEFALIIPPEVQSILATGDMELIGPALKSLFKDVLIPALPTVIGWIQTGLNSGTTKTYAYLPDGFSEDALLSALRNGNTFLTNGPLVFAELGGKKPDNRYGREVVLNPDGTAALSLNIASNREINSIYVIADGEAIMTIPVNSKTYKNEVTINLSGKKWVVIDVWGDMYARAYTNPFFLTTIDTAVDKAAKAELNSLIKTTLITNPAVILSNYESTPDNNTVNLKTALEAATAVLFNEESKAEDVNDAVTALLLAIDPAETLPFAAEALTLQPGTDATALNFNWYSDRSATNNTSVVKIAKESDPSAAISVIGTAGDASNGKSWHKAGVTNLTRNTVYTYCVSNDGTTFSETYSFKTGDEGAFQFIAVGDPQLTLGNQDTDSVWPDPVVTTKAGWQYTMDMISKYAPNAAFMAGTGDQVDTQAGLTQASQATTEAEYVNYFAPTQLRSLPVAPAAGNHELTANAGFNKDTDNFNWHFNLPNENTSVAGYLGNYWYTYNNALYVVLNSAPYPTNAAQVDELIAVYDEVLAEAVAANPGYKWLFVQHHKTTASPASHQTDADVLLAAPAFNSLMDKYNVDFVLAGHDHVYSRSWFIKDNKKVDSVDYSVNTVTNPEGTLYITLTTASGLKYYDFLQSAPGAPAWVSDTANMYSERKSGPNNITGKPWYTNIGIQIKAPQFTTIDVSADSVTFKTYRTDTMAVIDEYTVTKTSVSKLSASVTTTELSSVGDLVEFVFSLRGLNHVNTIAFDFTQDGGNLEYKDLVCLNNFETMPVRWTDLGNGCRKGNLTLVCLGNTITSADALDVVKFLFTATSLGDATIMINSATVTMQLEPGGEIIKAGALIENGVATTSVVRVYSIYDITQDGTIGQADLAIVALACGIAKNDPRWNQQIATVAGRIITPAICDVNGDDKVDMLDLLDVFLNYTDNY